MDTLRQRIEAAKAQLHLQAPRIVLTMAQTGLALVTLRLQREGLPGVQYSTKPVPRFWLKPTNAAGRAYVKKEKKPTYVGLRGAQGMETRFVNLTYTGRMLRSLTVVPRGAVGFVDQAEVVSSNAEDEAKLDYNARRYGPLLAPNAQEQAQLNTYVGGELNRIVQRALDGQ